MSLPPCFGLSSLTLIGCVEVLRHLSSAEEVVGWLTTCTGLTDTNDVILEFFGTQFIDGESIYLELQTCMESESRSVSRIIQHIRQWLPTLQVGPLTKLAHGL